MTKDIKNGVGTRIDIKSKELQGAKQRSADILKEMGADKDGRPI